MSQTIRSLVWGIILTVGTWMTSGYAVSPVEAVLLNHTVLAGSGIMVALTQEA